MDERPARRRASEWLRVAVGIGISIACLVLISRRIDGEQLLDALRRATVPWLALAVGALALGVAAKAARWALMLRTFKPGLGVADAIGPYAASLALNNVLPLRLGDAYRVVCFRERHGVTVAQGLGIVAVERAMDLVAVVCIGAAFMPWPLPWRLGGIAAAALAAGAAWLWSARAGTTTVVAPEPGVGALVRLRTAIGAFAGSARRVLTVKRLPALALLTGALWMLEGLVYVAVFASVGSAWAAAIPWRAMAAGTLSTLIPAGPGYVGTFEMAVMAVAATGATATVAASVAVLVHVALWLPPTVAGSVWLLVKRRPGAS